MWVKLDDGFANHAKILAISVPARWLHVAALVFSGQNLTDGLIRGAVVPRLTDFRGIADVDIDGLVEELVIAQLWLPTGSGDYLIHHFLEFNPSRQKVLEERRLRVIAGMKGARMRWHPDEDGEVPDETIANAMATPIGTLMPRPDPSRPVPTRPSSTPGKEQERTRSSTRATGDSKRRKRADVGRRHLRRAPQHRRSGDGSDR